MANTGLLVGGVGIAALAAYAAFGKEKPRFRDEPMPRPGPQSGPASKRSAVGAPKTAQSDEARVSSREPITQRPTLKKAFRIGPYDVSIQDSRHHRAVPGESVEIGLWFNGDLIHPKALGLYDYSEYWERGRSPVGNYVPIAAANKLLREIERHAGQKAQLLKRKS